MTVPRPATVPELLAPAGDRDGLRAAVNFGADAVYLGLRGFNARARAANFDADELAEVTAELRPRGVRVYVALNTLAFDDELGRVAAAVTAAAEAGADALIVQDLGVARLAREICADLPLHASTQTSVGTVEGAAALARLGFERLIAPRELDVEQLAALAHGSDLGVEAFVHGAHCLSWSGQCQASLFAGGRSANRGRCAQPCRLPYGLEADCRSVEHGGHPLSPTDLVADALVGRLARAGVCSLKIEGRLKRPEYVAAAVRHYRAVLDRLAAGEERPSSADERRDLLQPFARTSATGHLEGRDHRRFVEGSRPGSLGLRVGAVGCVRGRALWLPHPEVDLKAGDGVAVVTSGGTVGGRLYAVEAAAEGGVRVELGPDADPSGVRAADVVWRTDDPRLMRELRQGLEGRSRDARPRRHRVEARLHGGEGRPLELVLDDGEGHEARVISDLPLERARTRPLDGDLVRQRVQRLGNSPFVLGDLVWQVAGEVSLPLGEVNRMRREAVGALAAARASAGRYRIDAIPQPLEWSFPSRVARSTPEGVYVLCRTVEQVRAAVDAGASTALCEPRPFEALAPMLDAARRGGLAALAALPRTEAPDESRPPVRDADGLLVRTLGQLERFRDGGLVLVGDASLNAVNAPAAIGLLDAGLDLIVPGRDLGRRAAAALPGAIPPARLAAFAIERPPLYHTAHCLFAAHLAGARDLRDCGQACRGRTLTLHAEGGRHHTVLGELPCRNTVYGAAVLDDDHRATAHAAGVRRFVVEFLDEGPGAARRAVRRIVRALGS